MQYDSNQLITPSYLCVFLSAIVSAELLYHRICHLLLVNSCYYYYFQVVGYNSPDMNAAARQKMDLS